MYDLNGNDYICKEELLAVLTMMVGSNIKTEQLLSIAERTIMEADTDKVHKFLLKNSFGLTFVVQDDLISFEEFSRVLEKTDVEQKMSIRFLD